MKKIISTILALAIMMTMCITAFSASGKLGDVNGDNKISAVDARMVLQCVAGLITKTEQITTNGDVNEDGKITAVDARMILQIVAGIIPMPDDGPYLSADKTQLTIKDTPEVVYITMMGAETVVYYIDDTDVVTCEWGEWDGNTIPLTFYPVSDGHTTVDVYIEGYDECIEIDVTVSMPKNVFGAGETWTVPGQWEITINSATVHNLCNSYSNKEYGYTNQQVVLVEYTYKNLGLEDDLYLCTAQMDYYDGDLEAAGTYACTHRKYPKECIIGAKCTATEAIILENYSDKVTVSIEMYDSNSIKQKVTFEIPIEGVGDNDENNDENNNSSYLRIDEKLRNHILVNGNELTNNPDVYAISAMINGQFTAIYYDLNEDAFKFLCNITLDDGETLVFMNYKYGKTTQEVVTSSTFYSNSYEFITSGYVYTSTYSQTNENVYVTSYNNSSASNAKAITESATSILMMQIEVLLSSTGTGVTLNSLGFTAW